MNISQPLLCIHLERFCFPNRSSFTTQLVGEPQFWAMDEQNKDSTYDYMISVVPCSFFDFFKIIRIWKKHPQPSVELPLNKKIPNDLQFSWNPTKVMDLAGLLFVEFLGWLFQGWEPGMGWGWDGMDSQALAGWCGWFKAGVPMGFLFSWSLRPTWFQGVIGLGVIFDWWLKGGNHPPFMHFGSILLTQ